MVIETTIWDPTERLTSPEAEFAYLEAAFEDGDPSLIAAAIGDIRALAAWRKSPRPPG